MRVKGPVRRGRTGPSRQDDGTGGAVHGPGPPHPVHGADPGPAAQRSPTRAAAADQARSSPDGS
ncbi:hypothetical protein GCM10023082_23300 [Streptomyces tremellae]|uniref:Uncharacterized protein n=1 Tax=Streptomyces tremellae TaxID=1124239 RepID=A0ABP7EUJ9_9ACTN